jgi:hypothetical protein
VNETSITITFPSEELAKRFLAWLEQEGTRRFEERAQIEPLWWHCIEEKWLVRATEYNPHWPFK